MNKNLFTNHFIMSDLDAPLNTTSYDNEELDHFEKLLREELEETKKEKANIKESLNNLQDNSNDKNSAAAHHQGDLASDEEEREKFLVMLRKQDEKLDEITAALDRIELGTYGICEDTGKRIQRERLEAIPYTRFSVDAKQNQEE